MRVIHCSKYLERQQEKAERAAEEALRRPIARPRGLLARVGWWLTGGEARALWARVGEARDREADAARYAQGRAGEELLERVLGKALGDRYTLLRNYTPQQDRRGDIDAVLVGPHGITSFEVKAWRGYYRATRDSWLFREHPGAGWRPAEKNPTAQALENGRRLRVVLARAGLESVPVRDVVAVASPRMYVEVVPPLAVALFFATRPQPRLEAELGAAVLEAKGVARVLAALLPEGVEAAKQTPRKKRAR